MRNRFKALQAAVCADWGEWQVAREGIACESRDLPAMNDHGEVPMKVDKKLSLLEETSKKKEHPTNCSCQRTDRWSLDGEEFCHFDWMRTYEGITGERYRNTLIICATSVIATNEVWSHRRIFLVCICQGETERGQTTSTKTHSTLRTTWEGQQSKCLCGVISKWVN